MRISRINILEKARALFPANEIGYRGFFKHPGAKIVAADPAREQVLSLVSDVPRTLENGRYYPGWDPCEATRFLRQEFIQNGYEAEPVQISSDLFEPDLGILSAGSVYTLSPGLEPVSKLRGGVRAFDPVTLDLVWQHRRQVELRLTERSVIIDWQGDKRAGFMSHAGIYFQMRGILTISLDTSLIKEGEVSEAAITDLHAPLTRLNEIKQLVTEGETGDAVRQFLGAQTNARGDLAPIGADFLMTSALNIQLVGQVVPEVVAALDSDLTRMWSLPLISYDCKYLH